MWLRHADEYEPLVSRPILSTVALDGSEPIAAARHSCRGAPCPSTRVLFRENLATAPAPVPTEAASGHIPPSQNDRLERERLALEEREHIAEERESLTQASRVYVQFLRYDRSTYSGGPGWRFCIANTSSAPVQGTVVRYKGQLLPLDSYTGHLSPNVVRQAWQPDPDERPLHAQSIVEFTDVAGIRWRRVGSGTLQRRLQIRPDDTEVWGSERPPLLDGEAPEPEWFRAKLSWLDGTAEGTDYGGLRGGCGGGDSEGN
ncbi:hypothetical protein GCM10018775_87690 [Streptomyces umbrinus]|nr:hypothetical protein GCM10018775_87690 [Streptomyces umbrinus]